MILEKILWELFLACNNYEIIDLGVMVLRKKFLRQQSEKM